MNGTTCLGASPRFETFAFWSEGGGGLEGITFPHDIRAQALKAKYKVFQKEGPSFKAV